MTDHARAILVLPSGHRAFDEDFHVTVPVPPRIDVSGAHGVYHYLATFVGTHDDETRCLYVLGGRHLPSGFGPERHAPDEAYDQ